VSGSERRLSRFVDDILRNRRPLRFRASPEELAAMRAAAELRASRVGADLPDPLFVDRLGRQLREELAGEAGRSPVSRRRLLLTACTATAAAVAGGITGAVGDRLTGQSAPAAPGQTVLVPTAGTWRPVMTLGKVPDGQVVPFTAGAVQGFVINQDGRVHAVSAVCTHLGCTLQNTGAGTLACPCHRSAFRLDGTVSHHELPRAPGPLPLLRTRVRDGQVEVFVV
jgi:cytochrome b6-f complex iron-sulfur subunit